MATGSAHGTAPEPQAVPRAYPRRAPPLLTPRSARPGMDDAALATALRPVVAITSASSSARAPVAKLPIRSCPTPSAPSQHLARPPRTGAMGLTALSDSGTSCSGASLSTIGCWSGNMRLETVGTSRTSCWTSSSRARPLHCSTNRTTSYECDCTQTSCSSTDQNCPSASGGSTPWSAAPQLKSSTAGSPLAL